MSTNHFPCREGVGAVCSPLAATQFADMPKRWSFHFLISLGLAIINTIFLLVVFRLKKADGECPRQTGAFDMCVTLISILRQIVSKKLERSVEIKAQVRKESSSRFSRRRMCIFSHSGALSTLGWNSLSEVSASSSHNDDLIDASEIGWTVSYLQEHRSGGSSAGYVSTGFFGGQHILVQKQIRN